MYRSVDENIKKDLQALAEEDEGAARFFEAVAHRERDRSETPVRIISQQADLDYRDALELAKRLADLGCGRYIIGRRGEETRIQWFVPITQIGQAALAGGTANGRKELVNKSVGAASVVIKAKQLVAEAFDTTPEAVEITIKV